MSRVWAFIVFLFGIVKLEVVKIGIINDLHYEPYYQSGAPISNNCRGPTPFEIINYIEAATTPFGTHGCDAPLRLINLVLDKVNEIDPDIQVLLVSGDFVSHGYAVELGMSDHYLVLKEIIEYVFIEILAKKFPHAVILPAIGNNDIKFHYVAPQKNVSAPDYYPFMRRLTFEKIPMNVKYFNSEITTTFDMFGGYRIDYSPSLSFISFNSLYYNDRTPSNDTDVKKRQLNWLAEQLDNAEPGRKFVIFFHIYPGMYFIGRIRFFWERPAVLLFNDIIQRNINKISLLTGAHTHFPDMKVGFPHEFSLPYLMSLNDTSLELLPSYAILITPSVSPVFNNNPGFTCLIIENQVPKNITWHYFEMNLFPKTESEAVFNSVDFVTYMGISEFTPVAVLKFIKEIVRDKVKLYKYLSHKIGYRGVHTASAISFYQNLGMVNLLNEYEYYCSLLNMLRTDYFYCVESSKQTFAVGPM